MRKVLFLSMLVLAGLFAASAQQAKADRFGISFGIGVPGFYGYYGHGYDYYPQPRYYSYDRPYYRSYYYQPYYSYDYYNPGYYYYYGAPSFRLRYDYGDRYYRGYRHYDRDDHHHRR